VVFGYGSHPLATADDAHPVSEAVAAGNRLRVVFDELLVGNHLEEIACRDVVDDDMWARVPLGADPDDIARCAAADDELRAMCSEGHPQSVCLCQRAEGCMRGGIAVPQGDAVGVLDANLDGAADRTRLIAGSVGIRCTLARDVVADVAIDLSASFWTPSGNQTAPASGGFDALGPAVVLVPRDPLPTSARCGLAFSPEVTDKQGLAVCASVDGSADAACTPGDVSAVQFGVEPLALAARQPRPGSVGVSRAGPILIDTNAPVSVATLAAIQISPAPPGAVTASVMASGVLQLALAAPLAALTLYTVTIPTAVTDTRGQPLPAPIQYSFTTGSL
jgi:hypothetical protein